MFKKIALMTLVSVSAISGVRCDSNVANMITDQVAAHPAVAKALQNAGIALASALAFDSFWDLCFKIDAEKYEKDLKAAELKEKKTGKYVYASRELYHSRTVRILAGTGMTLAAIAGCVAFVGFGQSVGESLGIRSLSQMIWG